MTKNDNMSLYDPSRKTVGALYRDLQMKENKERVTVGDMTNELKSSLVVDLNETIESDPHQGRDFYITVHESKDLQMPSLIRRRMLTSVYRPYPEDDTLVFWVSPSKSQVLFCWCLPHWSEMDNMLANEGLFEADLIREIKAWKNFDLYHFGFTKSPMGDWIPNEHFKDKPMTENQNTFKILLA